jgi:hypothetical protein
MLNVMAIAAVGLTASQAWLAWEIWKEPHGLASSLMLAIKVSSTRTWAAG